LIHRNPVWLVIKEKDLGNLTRGGKAMNTLDRFLFNTGVGWELLRLAVVFTPVSTCLFVLWWVVRSD
jgi:hypothetical protein